jgi:dienelactone hydrolase
MQQEIRIQFNGTELEGDLAAPDTARAFVVFAHGSGSSRHSPRNRYVADVLRSGGLGTLLVDLLTREEEQVDLRTTQLRFNIDLLAGRLLAATEWLRERVAADVKVGYFGASTGGGAALVAAADKPEWIYAVVSRGGRPDLAGAALPAVSAPTLLIVGGNDHPVMRMNQEAQRNMTAETQLVTVPGASHLFEEPGTLEEVARLARDWFLQHLDSASVPPASGRSASEPSHQEGARRE